MEENLKKKQARRNGFFKSEKIKYLKVDAISMFCDYTFSADKN